VLVTGSFAGEIDFGAAVLAGPTGIHEVCPEGPRYYDEYERGECSMKPWAGPSMFVLRTRPKDGP
jgi:hypothetical protein